MKILLTTSFYPPYHLGGDAVHVKYLAEALVKKGHEVHVLHSLDAFNFKSKKRVKVPKKSKVIIHTLKSPLGVLEPILNYCFRTQSYTMSYFKNLVKKERFDIVHHHNVSLLGHNILKKQGPYINLYTAHDYWLICCKYNFQKEGKICKEKNCFSCCLKHKKVYQFFRHFPSFKKCVKDIDIIIAPSEFMKNELGKEYNNIQVLYNFIPEEHIKPKTKKIRNYFMFAGALENLKGILDLTKVFSKLDKRLLIAGTGSLELELKKIKTKNIELLGWINHKDLFNLMNNSQALIIPSQWAENNPLIALEGLRLGVPVIGSDFGGIPEIVEKIDKKLVFKNFKELKKLVFDFDREKYPAKKIMEVYNKNFSQEVFFRKYNKLIKENVACN